MNKTLKTGFRILAMVILVTGLFASCKSGGKKAEGDDTSLDVPLDNPAIFDDLQNAEKIFNALPSPLESAMLVKSAGARFDDRLLNPVGNTKNYVTNKSMALNLGIYTCDLSFASLYDQTQLIINYMEAGKKMADGLGILEAIQQEQIDRLEENITNKEVILEIVSETFMNSNAYLEENNQHAIAAIVLAGGWIEGLYISTQLVDPKDFNGNKLVGRIIDQKYSVDILLDLLDNSKGDQAVDELIAQVGRIKAVFDKVTIETTAVTPEHDQATDVTTLRSEVKSDMSPEVFRELSSVVSEIRNSFVK